MLKFLVVIFAIVFSNPAFAINEESKTELNALAISRLYIDKCEKNDDFNKEYNRSLNKYSNTSEVQYKEYNEYMDTMYGIYRWSIEGDEEKIKKFCFDVESAFSESFLSDQKNSSKTYSEDLWGRKFSLMIDMVILGLVGVIIGFAIGFPIKLISGKNVLTESWWILGWMFGFPILVRALVQAGYLG